jgi:DNA-binding MarR family transcriptional regulator
VTRRRFPDDARVLVVSLTDAGARRRRELDELMQAVQDEVFGALTADQRRRLAGYLRRLSDGS